MKLVIQRCQEASVSVNGKTVGAIEKGLMVLTVLLSRIFRDSSKVHRKVWDWDISSCVTSREPVS